MNIKYLQRNPLRVHKLPAPELVRTLRHVNQLHIGMKLTTHGRNTGYESLLITLRAAAKYKGIIWNADERDLKTSPSEE